jgi:hypothetical protein
MCGVDKMKTFSISQMYLVPCLGAMFFAGPTLAATCTDELAALDKVKASTTSAFQGYSDESKNDQTKGGISADFDVKWGDQEFIFDTPTVTIKQQKLIFGVPQVTMRTRDIIFSTPSVVMRRVKTGQYPEFFCDTHTVIPKCTVKWSDTFADVPEPFPQEQHIKLDLPEFTFGDVQVIMGVPEFSMQRQRWVIGLPQFTLKNINVSVETGGGGGTSQPEPPSDGDDDSAFESRLSTFADRVRSTKKTQSIDQVNAAHSLYECLGENLRTQQVSVQAQYDSPIQQISSIITTMKGQGIDPSAVGNGDGTSTNFVARRDELMADRDHAVESLRNAQSALDKSETDLISQLQ